MNRRLPLALLLACVALVTIPGSNPHSGSLTVSVSTSEDRLLLIKQSDGTTATDLTAAAGEQVARIADDGYPALPYRIVRVMLPAGTMYNKVDTRVVASEMVVESGFKPVIALQERLPEGEPGLAPAPMASAGPDAFPAEPVRYLGTGVWHGRSIASFAVFPLQVSGGSLRLASEIELTLRTSTATEEPVARARVGRLTSARAGSIERTLARAVVNPEVDATYGALPVRARPDGGFMPTVAPSLEGSPVDNVIITTDELAAAYQRLADRRTAQGFPTVVRTTEWIEQNYRHGADVQETIRHFVRDAYEKWGAMFFLLGGDTKQLPPRYLHATYYYGGTDIPADIYFAGLDGSWNEDRDAIFGEQPDDVPDVFTEVYVCRLPTATVADVDLMIDKIISYETSPQGTYGEKFLYLAEVLFPTNWAPPQTIENNGATTAEYLNVKHLDATDMVVARSYETDYLFPGSVPESRAAAIDSMNAGFNHIFHIGHGFRFNMHCADANVTIPDADALTNDDRFFNLYMLNCTANAFDFDCIGEHFMLNPTGGAVSAIGASNSAFASAASYYMDNYMAEVFIGDANPRIGEAHGLSRVARAPIATLADNADYWTHLIYAGLADPSMPLYNGPVDSLQVVHPDTIEAGVATFDVSVSSGGSPQDSAIVCVWKGTEDYQIVATDALGVASFTFTCETPGSLSVVVTGVNRTPYSGRIEAIPAAGAYLTFAGATVDDDSSGGTYGNGDGVIDAGETVDLTPQVKNTGTAPSLAATMTLSTGNADVTVLDAVASVGALAAGATAGAGDAWRIQVSVTAADESVCEFDISTTDGVGNWDDAFARLLHAPALEFTTIRVDDSVLGNNDGVIQSAEQFHLYVSLKNYGTGAACGITGAATDASGGGVSVVSGADSYPDLGPLVESENVAGFIVSEGSVLIENAIAITATDLFGRAIADTIELRAPDPPSNLSFDASQGEDRLVVAWDGSPTPDVDRYHVYHSTTQGGPYTRATTDASRHSTFTDTGLEGNTRYYYVVTAIDSSGNESDPSAESSASTNPPQLLGWPNVVADPSSNSPVVGDIDGDNDLEIIVGNDFLYAWHHDGQEVRDGDAQSLTYGIFSDQGGGFIGPAALAKIDSDTGLEIIAASWSTYEIYIFNHNGTVLPGWPRPTINRVRAGVVVGDIDGDTDPEIIAVDEDAYLYVWHHDGSEYRDGDSDPLTDGVFYRLPDTPWWHYQSPCLADIDNDNQEEIIIGTQDEKVYVFNEDGTNVPGWPRTLSSFAGGGIAVGDIDGNGDLDLVVPTKNVGEIIALRPNNSILWIRWFPQNLFFNPSPALADIDNNGTLETFLPASNGNIYGIASNGANLPGWPVTYSSTTYTESSPIIADVDGDGVVDILLGDESKYIYAWNIVGQPVDGFPLVTKDAVRGTPAVADADRNGTVEIIAAGYDRTVYVWDFSAPYDATKAPWPMKGANWHRNGVYGYQVVTAAGDAAFAHEVRADGLLARWTVPLELGSRFDVERATVSGDERGDWMPVANGVYSVGGTVELTDRGVRMGETYVYRLIPESGAAIESVPVRIPVTRAAIEQNYPNPFNPTTTIVYFVPERDGSAPQPVSLTVYDVTGARVRTLVDADVAPGRYALEWNGVNEAGERVGSGVYFYRVVMPGYTATKKMVLIK